MVGFFINTSLQITRKQREVVEIFSMFSCLYVLRLYNKSGYSRCAPIYGKCRLLR